MKVLVVGGGGREHAIVKSLSTSQKISKLYAAPGNGGIAELAECVPIKAVDVEAMTQFALNNHIDYVVVAPDDPLCLGMVDELNKNGIPAFGPTKAAAQIEGSKSFSKDLMKRYNIPTAQCEIFEDSSKALEYVRKMNSPLVIKADGLALGKGVILCDDVKQAEKAVIEMMEERKFGESGKRIVIEEYLYGPEVTVLSFSDGNTVVPMVSSMDHKRALNGDKGLNTGGMGVIAPNPYYTDEIATLCMNTIFQPTINAMKKEGIPFKGCLYFGLMLTNNGPKVIEYNCRFGDPETQAILPLLESDLFSIMQSTTNGTLSEQTVSFSSKSSCCVVLASGGYPESYQTGKKIDGIADAEKIASVYHAGTTVNQNREYFTAGGRVLAVSATGTTLKLAIEQAYKATEYISFENLHKRDDIGHSAINA